MSSNAVNAVLKILVVENHPDTLRWLSLYLEDAGHIVEKAKTFLEGCDKLSTTEFDVLISDIGLPDGKGWDLLRDKNIKQPRYAIAMSGFGMNADSERTKAAGFRHHLVKPFKMHELDLMLEQALKERQ